MDAIRRIITAKDVFLNVLLPEAFRNRRLEVIIIPADEISDKKEVKEKFDFANLYGKAKSGLSMSEIDEKLKQMRNEWDGIPG